MKTLCDSNDEFTVRGRKSANLDLIRIIGIDAIIPESRTVHPDIQSAIVHLDQDLLKRHPYEASRIIKETLLEKIDTLKKIAPLPEIIAGMKSTRFAVRPSVISTTQNGEHIYEDGKKTSNAGRFESFLNVAPEYLHHAIILGYWSSFSPRNLANQQINPLKDRMSIIIQEYVPVDKSFVLFTSDDISKNPDRMYFEAAYGVCEGIVSGALTPDLFVYNKKKSALEESDFRKQTKKMVHLPFNPENTSSRQIVQIESQEIPCLTSDEQQRIIRLGLELEKRLGPQDIEGGFKEGKMYVFQTRPITRGMK